MEKNIKEIKDNINLIYSLVKNNIREKEQYRIPLNNLEQFMLSPTQISTNSITTILNTQMETLKQRVNQVNENPTTKIGFWLSYIYWAAWSQFRQDGIGHVYNFYIEHSCIKIFVNIQMSVHKDFLETSEAFKKRKELFDEYLKSKDLNFNDNKLIDNEKNKKFIKDYISQFCNPKFIEFTSKDGYLKSFSFYVDKNGNYSFYKEKTKEKEVIEELTDLDLEKMEESVKEWYQSISFLEDCLKHENNFERYKKTVSQLSLTIYTQLCELCNLSNSITKDYNDYITPNKEINKQIRKKEEEIGETYNIPLIIDILKNVRNNLETELKKQYCLYIETFKMSEVKTITLKWNNLHWHTNTFYELNKDDEDFVDITDIKSKLDIMEDMTNENSYLAFTDNNISFIENIISKQLFSEIKDINISYYNGKRYIYEITFNITNFESFLQEYNKEGNE